MAAFGHSEDEIELVLQIRLNMKYRKTKQDKKSCSPHWNKKYSIVFLSNL